MEYNSKAYVSFSHSVPPLTQGNVLEAVKGVQDWDRLRYYFGVDPVSSLEDAVEEFLLGRGFYQPPSWRAVIFILDLMGKAQIADCIRNHGEPVQGGCMCFPSAAPIIRCGPGWISRANNTPLIIQCHVILTGFCELSSAPEKKCHSTPTHTD